MKIGSLTAAAIAVIGLSVAACSDDAKTTAAKGDGGHTSPYPSCHAITQSCHEVDVGDGPIHDCHDKAHGAAGEADCSGIKESCLRICAEAKADAGSAAPDGGAAERDE